MKVLLIGNLTDKRCGFMNFTQQTLTALERQPDISVEMFDGTYSAVYARQQDPNHDFMGMFPENIAEFDVVHLVWNAMTMNHYTGAPWEYLHRCGVTVSWWDGGPSDATCPFIDWMQVRWSDYPREGYIYCPYPVPDWVDNLPAPNIPFTVGGSSVRGDGIPEITEICQHNGWLLNLPTPGRWLSVEDEVRRLARSTVNVCWYNTPPLWKNRASAPSMMLASKRPILVNEDPLVAHLADYTGFEGVYHGLRHPPGPHMEQCLRTLFHAYSAAGELTLPEIPCHDLGWDLWSAVMVNEWLRAKGSPRG